MYLRIYSIGIIYIRFLEIDIPSSKVNKHLKASFILGVITYVLVIIIKSSFIIKGFFIDSILIVYTIKIKV